MSSLRLNNLATDDLWLTTRKSFDRPVPIKSKITEIDDSVCFIWREGHLVAIGMHKTVVNSAGKEIGKIEGGRSKRRLELIRHVEKQNFAKFVDNACVLRHSIVQFGYEVPVYFFTFMQIEVDERVWRKIIRHVDKFCPAQVDQFEHLAQVVGHFLPPAASYERDVVFTGLEARNEQCGTGDDFSCPASIPFKGFKTGDCEDFAILCYCMFNNLKTQFQGLVPIADHYIAVLADCVIEQSEKQGLHMCCLLVPVKLFDHWLQKSDLEDRTAHNPILLLESTERSLSSTRPRADLEKLYSKCIDGQLKGSDKFYDLLSLLYPVSQYIRDGFYLHFYSLYTNHGKRRHYVPFLNGKLGFSLQDLCSNARFDISVRSRFEREYPDQALAYIKTCLPPNLKIESSTSELEGKEEERKGGRELVIPFYYPNPQLGQAVKTCWNIDISRVERLQVSLNFNPMYVGYYTPNKK